MYYHEAARLVYLAHPRTASVATATALQKVQFKQLGGNHHMRLWEYSPPRSSPKLQNPLPYGFNVVTPENRHEWTVFTCVRNHWDAAVSWVFKRYKDPAIEIEWKLETFVEALNYNGWVDANRMWALHSDDANIIMRYETLDADFERVLSRVGPLAPRITRHNVSRKRAGRHYREFYVAETRDYIYDRFRSEIEALAYEY